MFRNLKKQTAFILLVLVTLLMTMSTALATTYVGSVNSDKFHYTYCRYAKRIYDENKIYFYSRDEALNSGYIPCKVCRP